MADADPKERLLNAAERLFAEQGFGASLRAITSAAGANIAAVNYHFGSKEKLVEAVFARRIAPVNAKRLALLEQAEAAAAPKPASVEAILEALVRPLLELSRSDQAQQFVRFAGRLINEPGDQLRFVLGQFGEIRERAMRSLSRALPRLDETELAWRLHFTIGVCCHTMTNAERLPMLTWGKCSAADDEIVLAQIVDYAAAGFRAEHRS